MEAGIYARISEDRDGSAAGVTRQEVDCRHLCDRMGWNVHKVYVDNDQSAYRGKVRPAYEELLDDLKGGAVGAVACWHPDRLTRRPLELERLIDVIETVGARVATVSAGEYDLSTASGRMVARILGSVARAESERMGERVRRAGEERARQGLHNGGPRSFGYTTGREVDPAEAVVVREMMARYLAGESLRSLSLWLRQTGVPSVRGGPWGSNHVRQVLRSPAIAGLRQLRGEVIGPAKWDAIVDRDDWEQARARMDGGSRYGSRPRRHLLTGILRCSRCGVGLHARPALTYSGGRNMPARYHCPPPPRGCHGTTVDQEAVEADVLGQLFAVLDDPVSVAKLHHPPDWRQVADLAALERQLVDLAELWAAGALGRAEWLAARSGVEERLRAARTALGGSERVLQAYARSTLRQDWDGLPFDVRRAFVEATIERVEVGPAVRGRNFYGPERIREPIGRIVWRV